MLPIRVNKMVYSSFEYQVVWNQTKYIVVPLSDPSCILLLRKNPKWIGQVLWCFKVLFYFLLRVFFLDSSPIICGLSKQIMIILDVRVGAV